MSWSSKIGSFVVGAAVGAGAAVVAMFTNVGALPWGAAPSATASVVMREPSVRPLVVLRPALAPRQLEADVVSAAAAVLPAPPVVRPPVVTTRRMAAAPKKRPPAMHDTDILSDALGR